MGRAILLSTDNTVTEVDIDFGLESLQKVVGGYIEHVSLPRLDYDVPMGVRVGFLVNEEGRLDNLPYNENATRLYAPKPDRTNHFIAGPALLIAVDQNVGEEIPLPDCVTLESIMKDLELYEGH